MIKTFFVAGSRKFFEEIEEFVKQCRERNLNAVTADKEKGESDFGSEKEALQRAFNIIDHSEAVYVFSKDGYVGKTVCIEIAYAYAKGKEVFSSELVGELSARSLVSDVVPPEKFIELFSTGNQIMATERFKLLIAVHLFLIHDNRVLLLRRFNTGYEDGNYSVVAGHLDGDEEIRTAMVREAWEEAGIGVSPDHLQVVGVMHRKSNDERIDFFLATSTWSGEIVNREPTRCDQLTWFDLEKLPENMVPYARRALDSYRRGRWFDSFGWL